MEEKEYLKTIEINGVKLEVDLRTCKKIDTYKIGDNVKLLKKEYGGGYKVYSGVIVDFVNFKELPSIVIAYFDESFYSVDIKFETITKDSTDVEITPCLPHEMEINKERVIDLFNLKISEKKKEVLELENKKDYFLRNFAKFFKDVE